MKKDTITVTVEVTAQQMAAIYIERIQPHIDVELDSVYAWQHVIDVIRDPADVDRVEQDHPTMLAEWTRLFETHMLIRTMSGQTEPDPAPESAVDRLTRWDARQCIHCDAPSNLMVVTPGGWQFCTACSGMTKYDADGEPVDDYPPPEGLLGDYTRSKLFEIFPEGPTNG